MRKRKIYLTAAICACLLGTTGMPVFAEDSEAVAIEETETDITENVQDDQELDIVSEEDNNTENEDKTEDGIYKAEYFLELVENITSADTIEENSYEKVAVDSSDNLCPGDIMVDGDTNMYVYTGGTVSESFLWYSYADGGLEAIDGDVFEGDGVFYRHIPETPLVAKLDTIKTPYGSYIYDIVLPSGYEWNCEDERLSKIGTKNVKVLYTPENTLKYGQGETTVDIEVERIKRDITNVPESSYEISYYPNNTINSISLPSGWSWEKPDTVLAVGTHKYKAVYEGNDIYEYIGDTQMSITVKVNKSVFEVSAVSITVTKGTKLTNSLLPKMNEGSLAFTEKNLTADKSFTTTCKFTPSDKAHYNSTSGISVVVNVVPMAVVKPEKGDESPTEKPTEEPTTENPNTDTNENQNTEKQNSSSNPFNVVSRDSNKNNTNNNTGNNANGNTGTSQVAQAGTDNRVSSQINSKNSLTQPGTNGQTGTQTNQNVQTPNISLPTINLTGTDAGKKNETTKTDKKADNKKSAKLPTVDLTNVPATEERTTESATEKIETSEVVGDILENQEKDASEATSTEDSSSSDTTETTDSTTEKTSESENEKKNSEKKKSDPLGVIAIFGLVGMGGYFGFKKLKAGKFRR